MDKRIKQVSRGIVVMAVCVSALLAFASDCRTKVETFLGSPSKVNYLQLVDSQGTTASSHCWEVIANNRENRNTITGLVMAGNQWAARLTAINLKVLDGGDLEDALIILGLASRSAPKLLLSLDVDGTISDHELGDAATMLPESFVDKRAERINELKMRVQSFRSIRDRRLRRPQSYVLKELLSHIRDLESVTEK
jgi:hypothetical protein